jgi:hypothetical protein
LIRNGHGAPILATEIAAVDSAFFEWYTSTALDEILKALPVYMMIGIVLVVGISQFNRILGGVLGVVFWTAVAFIGLLAYDQGGAIGILDIRFPREIFVALCLLFVGIHAAGAWSAWKRKRSLPPPRTESDMQGDD